MRRLYKNQVVVGFAGAVADAFTLCDKFEGYLEEYHGNLQRAAVSLAKEWRTDKMLRNLEALMVVASGQDMLILSGNGEVIAYKAIDIASDICVFTNKNIITEEA